MRRSGQAGLVVVVAAVVVAAASARPLSRSGVAAAGRCLDARRVQAEAAFEYNQRVAAELTAGGIGLADATDRVIEAHIETGYLPAIHVSLGGRTVRESIARSLVHRAENPLRGPPVERPALRAEFARLFGHPFVPPG